MGVLGTRISDVTSNQDLSKNKIHMNMNSATYVVMIYIFPSGKMEPLL